MVDKTKKYDFGGWATRYDVLCSDGRKILPNAFAHSDGKKLPLVWRHLHDELGNVLGHVVLENRKEGVYAYGVCNDTDNGKHAKLLIQHGDITALSIYANQLVEKNKLVHAGQIREVSLVHSGANPEAFIDYVSMTHEDGFEEVSDTEAVIYTGLGDITSVTHEETEEDTTMKKEELKKEAETEAEEKEDKTISHADDDKTVGEVFETLNEEQKQVVYAIVSAVVEAKDEDLSQSDEDKGENMKKNVFDGVNDGKKATLTHEQQEVIFQDAVKMGSLKKAFLAHAGDYGIDNIGYLFPDAQTTTSEPYPVGRDQSWVAGWMNQTKHLPFSRVKSVWADLTPDAVRAKGYVTGALKLDEVLALLKRTTDPTTVYKKQKLDRDDILDITDFNVVAWLKAEMRMMLDEEIARAGLVGDGRSVAAEDHIAADKIRPIYGDSSVFAYYLTLESTVTDWLDIMDAIVGARANYKGTGTPNFYTTEANLAQMLLLRDTTDRRLYRTVSELASELRVADVIPVEVFEGVTRDDPTPFTADLLGIMVNPTDYVYGADKGGQVALFDDFDIDYNQYKYLIETRCSGALVRPRTAMCVERKQA